MRTGSKILIVLAGLLIAAKAIEAGSPLSGTNSKIPRSAAPGASQGVSSSTNFRLRSTAGEVKSSTMTSAEFRQFSGAQNLLSWPGTVTGLSALTGPGENAITLSWTAPGADGTAGSAGRYEVRYRLTGAISTQAEFDGAFIFVSTKTPQSPGTSESLTVTGLSAGPTYYFCVVAVDSFTVHSFLSNGASSWAYGPPDTVPPANISDLTALTGAIDGRIGLNWTSPGDNQLTGNLDSVLYRVHASTTPFAYFSSTHSTTQFGESDFRLDFTTNGVAPGTPVGVDIDGLNPGTTWYAAVITRDSSLNWSSFARSPVNSLSSAAARDLPLDAPGNQAFSQVVSTGITVSWDLPAAPVYTDDRVSYRLYAATAAFTALSDPWVQLSSTVAHPLTQAATGYLTPNTSYFFAVTAVDSGTVTAGLYSIPLESAFVMIATRTPAAVPGVSTATEVNLSSITVVWSPNGNPLTPSTSYEMQISTAFNFTGTVTSSFTYATAVTTASLRFNTSYYFRVRAINLNGLASAFNAVLATATLSSTVTLNSPDWAAADLDVRTATAVWNANGNPSGTLYHVEFATSVSFAGAVTSSDTYNLFASSYGLAGNTTVAFRVQAVNFNHLRSSFTASLATSTLAGSPLEGSPTSFIDVQVTSAGVHWISDFNHSLTEYQVEISTASDFSGDSDGAAGWAVFPLSSHTFLSLTSETTYYAQVRARNALRRESAYKFLGSTVTLDNVPPSAVTSLSALQGGNTGEIALAWIAPGDNGTNGQALYYEVRRAVPPFDWATDFNSAVLVTNNMPASEPGTLENLNVNGLTPGTSYAFAVKAVDESGNRGGLSNGATTWATLPNNTAVFYLTSNGVGSPVSSRELAVSSGTGSNIATRVTPSTNNNYYILRPVVTLTGAGDVALPAATTTYGWMYNSSIGGLTIEGGSWTLKGRYQMSAATLGGSLHLRINRVTVTASSTAVKSFLTQGTDGWVQWGGGNLLSATAMTTTMTVVSIHPTYFEPEDRLMIEFAFRPTTGSNGTRQFRWEVNESSNYVQTTNIQDTTPPNVITALTGLNADLQEGEIRLQWLAPGDDGTNGQAAYYDIRYADSQSFNWESNFEGAAVWKSSRASTGVQGTQESELITGLTGGVTYYFRIKAFDDNDPVNSSLSAGATQWAQVDRVPPSNISDLTALRSSVENAVLLQWTAPGDDGSLHALVFGSSYTVRASTVSFTFYSSTVPDYGASDLTVRIGTDSVNFGNGQGYLLTGLNPGTTWFFGILANDERENNSVWNKTASFSLMNSTPAHDLPLSAPSSLYGLASASTALTIAWTQPGAPAGFDDRSLYRLYAATASFTTGAEPWVQVSSAVSHPLSQAATAQISPNTTYFFRASALDFGDRGEGLYSIVLESPLSALFSTATLAAIPVPTDFSEPAVGVTSMTFTWDQGENPSSTRYQVQISTDNGFGVYSASDTLTLAVTTRTLAANTTYHFRVRARNRQNLFSDFSAVLSTATVASSATLNSPQWSSLSVGVNVATAVFNANGNPDGTLYRVEFATGVSFAGAVTSSDTYNLFASSSGLTGNTTIAFRIQTVNFNRRVSPFVASQATATATGLPVLNTPNWATADIGISAATAAWTGENNTAGTRYLVQFATSASFAGAVTSSDTYNLFASSSGLTPNTTVAFRVLAINRQGLAGDFVTSVETATLANASVFTPFVPADITAASQTVHWSANANPSGTRYRIDISTYGDFSVLTASETFSLSISTLALSANTTHHFRGAAVNHQNVATAFSNQTATATLANAPASAASTFTFVGPADITVAWDANANPTDTIYFVYTATGPDFSGQTVTTAAVFVTNMSTAGLTENATYSFRVRAVNRQGFQTGVIPIGSTRTTVSTDFVPPNAVSDLTALTGDVDGRADLRWTSPGDDENSGLLNSARYRVRYSSTPFTQFTSTDADLSGLGASVGIGDVFLTTSGVAPGTRVGTLIDDLNPGTTYYFGVITRDDSSNWSFFNHNDSVNKLSSAAVRDLPLSAPAALNQTSVSSVSISIAWTNPAAPSGLDDREHYRVYAATASFATGAEPWVQVSSVVDHPLSGAATAQIFPNTTYFFRVSALDFGDRGDGLYSDALESPPSALFSTATLAAIPAPIAFTAPEVGVTSATFNWSQGANPSETLYQVQVSTDNGFGIFSTSDTFALSLTTQTLSANATYHFRLRAKSRRDFFTDYSAVLSTATLSSTATLTSPDWAVTSLDVRTATAVFNANGNPPGTLYRVEFATSATFAGAVTSSDTYNLFASSYGLAGNTTVAFRVQSVNFNHRRSPFVASLASATLVNAPLEGSPTSFANVQFTSAGVQWDSNFNTGHAEYQVELSTAFDFTGNSDVTAGWASFPLSSHTFQSLVSETTYYAQIRARNSQRRESAYRFLGTTVTLDSIPPSAVTQMTALRGATESKIDLAWIAPGDNASFGYLSSGSRFHIASTTILADAIDAAFWSAKRDQAEIQMSTSGVEPGTTRYLTVSSLEPGTTYFFRVWTRDDSGNWSTGLSRGATQWAQLDVTAPGALTDLTALTGSSVTIAVNLSWSMPGDDDNDGNIVGGTVTVKFRTEAQGGAILDDTAFNAAPFSRVISTSVNQGETVHYAVTGLQSETTYYFAVKTNDERVNFSGLSNSAFAVSPDTVTPSAVTSLSALRGANTGEISLSWIAPGDNGTTGQASYYEVRRAVPPFDWTANYNSAVLITNSMSAGTPGTLEELNVGGLTPGTTYAFAVKALDESGNRGGLSNGATTWATLPNNTTTFYLRTLAVSQPASAKGLSVSSGTGSNTLTRVTPATNNNYYVLQPVLTVTGGGSASLPAATTSFGWLYDSSLGGLTIEGGSWTLKGRYQMSNATLAGSLHYRINRVTATASSTTLKSHLTQGTNGWVQWGGGNLPSQTAITTTMTVASIHPTYFDPEDRLMIEFAFRPTAGSDGARRFHWEVNESSNYIQTTNIQDNIPPNTITSLTALNLDGNGISLTDGQIRLNWLAPGDDGTFGQAVYYDIRYSESELFNWESNFESAVIWNSSRTVSGVQGTPETELVTGLTGGVTYYFRIKAFDNADPVNNSLSAGATNTAAVQEIGVLIVGATEYNFGLTEMAVSTITTSSFTIRNVGNVFQDYKISATTLTANSPWSIDVTSDTDKLILWGGFSPARPGFSDFGAEDIILNGQQTSSATKFAISTSSGVTVPLNEDRFLWLRVDTPLITSTTDEQKIQVTVTGMQSP